MAAPIARRTVLGRWLGAGVLALLGRRAAAAPAPVVYLQPLGDGLPDADVALVERAVRAMLGHDVRRLPRVALPEAAYYPPRKRYRAGRLLTFLNRLLPADATRILGLTAVDISTSKGRYSDWGVIGLGEMPGTASVISSFRCHKKSRGPEHARERLAKTAVHELGHTLGLDHCPTVGCLMQDADGKVATSDGEYDFCGTCRATLAAAGQALPAAPAIPWPRP
jgi:archaemetzincin